MSCRGVAWHDRLCCVLCVSFPFVSIKQSNKQSVAEQPNISQLLQKSEGTSLCFIGCETPSSRRFDFSWRTWGGPERRPKSKDQLSSVTLN